MTTSGLSLTCVCRQKVGVDDVVRRQHILQLIRRESESRRIRGKVEPRKRDFRLPRCGHFINIDGFSLVVVALHSAGHKIVGRLAAAAAVAKTGRAALQWELPEAAPLPLAQTSWMGRKRMLKLGYVLEISQSLPSLLSLSLSLSLSLAHYLSRSVSWGGATNRWTHWISTPEPALPMPVSFSLVFLATRKILCACFQFSFKRFLKFEQLPHYCVFFSTVCFTLCFVSLRLQPLLIAATYPWCVVCA